MLPGEMLARLLPFRERFGVARLGSTTRLDRIGIETATAVRRDVVGESITIASGKSLDREEARLTALAEALERFAAEPRGRIPIVTAAPGALQGAAAPGDFALGPWARDRLPDEIDWCAAEPLGAGGADPTWLPAECVFFPYYPASGRALLFAPSTTGIAAAATLTEAVCWALYECIERDAHARAAALVTAEHGPRIRSLDTADLGARVQDLARRVRDAGFQLILRDLTHDLAVPAVMAIVVEGTLAHSGVAAHLAAEVAAERAILEAVQSRATDLQGAREDLPPPGDEAHPWFLQPDASPRGDPPASTPLGDIADEVALLVDRITSAELPAPAYVDLSLAGVPAYVVRVVAPGLEVWALDPDRVGRRVERWLTEP